MSNGPKDMTEWLKKRIAELELENASLHKSHDLIMRDLMGTEPPKAREPAKVIRMIPWKGTMFPDSNEFPA